MECAHLAQPETTHADIAVHTKGLRRSGHARRRATPASARHATSSSCSSRVDDGRCDDSDFALEEAEVAEELFKVHHGTEIQIEAHRMGRIGTPKCSCSDALDIISEQPCTFTLGGDCNNKQCTATWKEAGAKKGIDFAKCGNGHYYKWCIECKKRSPQRTGAKTGPVSRDARLVKRVAAVEQAQEADCI
jgi:hypothetical protein